MNSTDSNPTYDFTGQVAFVTGAFAGRGLAAARAFAEAGAAVAPADIDDKAVDAAAKELADVGHQALALVCDVSDEDQVTAVVDRTVDAFGRLDTAYDNAGVMPPPTDAADEGDAEQFDRVQALNLRGVRATMRHELRHMRTRGGGAIVSCSSPGGLVGNPGRAAHHATEHGVIGLTKSAALEYGARGVRVNAVCPGTLTTPMVDTMIAKGELDRTHAESGQAVDRLGTAEEIAQAVLWLYSPGTGYVTGIALPVDGGYTAR
ncbi:SDR family NAD(P)-dependent oxidoreductase [Streptomyces akebiae]|uniref:SDR family oxidoreductase n=1 Tax=Streptomyces akebiae TaxID=2865673 RepID=A0ABX8XJ78_9ACTN|nr:SDR family oxidoreductase [Streptomyces akebiae]QYX75659.1 SDR family oxidoreductase [Streptomyces akebiae]